MWDSVNRSTNELISIDMILMDERVSFNSLQICMEKQNKKLGEAEEEGLCHWKNTKHIQQVVSDTI
jgi:hypothetical protein